MNQHTDALSGFCAALCLYLALAVCFALQIINGLDAGITSIFGIEALLKISAFTFTAYIRVNSNKVLPLLLSISQLMCCLVYTMTVTAASAARSSLTVSCPTCTRLDIYACMPRIAVLLHGNAMILSYGKVGVLHGSLASRASQQGLTIP